MHCVCTTLCNCLFISICMPSQRLIQLIWCQFPFQMSVSQTVSQWIRKTTMTCFFLAAFILRCDTCSITLPLFSPSACLSLRSTPSVLSCHLNILSNPSLLPLSFPFLYFPLLKFSPSDSLSSHAPLLFLWFSFSPLQRCFLSDSLRMETKERVEDGGREIK